MMGVYLRKPLAERFWAKVDRSGGPDACWLWLGAKHSAGYGRIKDGDHQRRATHVSLELAGTPLAPGQQALHRCDNPPCVNPEHLLPGTMADNAADMIQKGRSAKGAKHRYRTHPELILRGERNGNAKLTEAQVREILLAEGSHERIAADRGVSQTLVSMIKRRVLWRHVTAQPDGEATT